MTRKVSAWKLKDGWRLAEHRKGGRVRPNHPVLSLTFPTRARAEEEAKLQGYTVVGTKWKGGL